ncbi:hypothetical protein ACF0H5_011948 [Mactra antiquata]
MILLFFFIYMFTLQRIFVESMQTTSLLEERIEKLERKGIEQETIIQMLLKDMQEQRKETKAQAEIIHELSMKLEEQAEQLVLKELAITQIGRKLKESKTCASTSLTNVNFLNMSDDNFSKSPEFERIKLKDVRSHNSNYNKLYRLVHTSSMEKKSTRQRRLQLPVPTQLPKMNIAFRVSNSLSNQVQGGPFIYNNVHLNLGGGYIPLTGYFTAPSNGLYLFSVSLLIVNHPQGQLEFGAVVVKNGSDLEMIFMHTDKGWDDQGSVTVITQLNVGDRVWVEMRNVGPDGGDISSSFSGVLIFQM